MRNDSSFILFNLPDIGFTKLSSRIPDKALYTEEEGMGREDEPHLSLLGGIKTKDSQSLKVFRDQNNLEPVTIKLGKLSLFENDDYDVLKIEVKSDGLHRLRKKAEKFFDFETKFPDYKPHITLAYLKPGKGKKYEKVENTLKGIKITLNKITFSDPDKKHSTIPLIENSVKIAARKIMEKQAVLEKIAKSKVFKKYWDVISGKEVGRLNKKINDGLSHAKDSKDTYRPVEELLSQANKRRGKYIAGTAVGVGTPAIGAAALLNKKDKRQ